MSLPKKKPGCVGAHRVMNATNKKDMAMSKNIIRTKEECQRILAEMNEAARIAAEGYRTFRSDKDVCGFAQVTIPKEEYSLRRAEGSPFPSRLYYRGQVPSTFARCGDYRSLTGLETVAKAMVDSLRRNGVQANFNSWMD